LILYRSSFLFYWMPSIWWNWYIFFYKWFINFIIIFTWKSFFIFFFFFFNYFFYFIIFNFLFLIIGSLFIYYCLGVSFLIISSVLISSFFISLLIIVLFSFVIYFLFHFFKKNLIWIKFFKRIFLFYKLYFTFLKSSHFFPIIFNLNKKTEKIIKKLFFFDKIIYMV
jgi:hypothetical protein